MPLEEPPALFGFHPNANITKNLKETEDICYDLIKMGEIEGVKNKSNKNTADKSKKPL
jgi:predicted transcriptional regulator